MVVEVLSPSTETYDRGAKFAHYRRMESLREYVMIAQDRLSVEHYARQGDHWAYREATEPTASVHVGSIDCELRLRDIYERVEFPPGEEADLPEP